MKRIPYKVLLLALSCRAVLMPQGLRACSTPVFQYAMERWLPDSYNMVVFHRGPLSVAEAKVLDQLRAQIYDSQPPANVKIQTADVSARLLGEDLSALYQRLAHTELPAIVLRYPRRQRSSNVVWRGRLTPETVQTLADSSVRREIARRLVAGDVAVWVLVECGEQERDDEAAGRLQAESLSTVRVSRTDPSEEIFLAMLLNSEHDLHEYADQPIVFPVFGRGHVLYALVGRGIVKENIAEVRQFLCGPCLCEIKAANPGIDLLMAANWDKALDQPLLIEEPLPPLTGVLPDRAQRSEVRGQRSAAAASRALVASGLWRAAKAGGQKSKGGFASDDNREETTNNGLQTTDKKGSDHLKSEVGLMGMVVLVFTGIAMLVIAGGAIIAHRDRG